MLDQLICQFNLMKDEINEIKKSSQRNLDQERQLIDEKSSNLQNEIEELKKEINQITRNNIPDLTQNISQIKREISQITQNNIPDLNQNITQIKREMSDHKTQEKNNDLNLQEEITQIKDEVVKLKDDQEKKADKESVIDLEGSQQAFQEKYEEEKVTIKDDLLKLKEKINKINKFVFLLDTNKTIFGTTWKVTKVLHDEGILRTREFQEQLSEFSHFNVEIEYPSDEFEAIYSEVLSLKRSGTTELTISIFVTGSTNKYFQENDEINSLKFDSSITEIEESSFARCSSLSSVSIPSSVTSIGYFAFYGCSSLSSVSIPSSVTSIGNYAFYGCSSLSSVSIPSLFNAESLGISPSVKVIRI